MKHETYNMDVIPVINCPDRECVEETLRKIRGFLPPGNWVHLDVADGQFTFHKTWNEVALWPTLKSEFNLEVHLMVERPDKYAAAWLHAGAKRVIVHWEAIADRTNRATPLSPDEIVRLILKTCKEYKAEVFLAVSPETDVRPIVKQFKKFAGAQTLAVHPGFAGQVFLPLTLEKIKTLRAALPDAIIEVDGGVTPEIAEQAKAAGANQVTSASYIFSSNDLRGAYEELIKA